MSVPSRNFGAEGSSPLPRGSDAGTDGGLVVVERSSIEGIDHDDQPIHIRIPGLMVSFCGVRLNPGTHLPAEEVTDASWCPDCDAAWSAVES